MGAWMIGIVTVLYLCTALDFALRGNWWMAMVFAGYAFSNIAFIGLSLKA